MSLVKNPLKYNYQPIILIGAGRSGTKIIRDVIGKHPDIAVVPYDVNYIWTIGQRSDHDALPAESLTDSTRNIIIKQFNKLSDSAPMLLEKTVSNCLRIPYVLKVFPDALFLHLVRDGRDVVESVHRQWGEVREVSYVMKKLKTFPLRHSLNYLMEYGTNWLKHGLGGKGKQDYIWGVKYPGYQKDLDTMTTLEVCAKQWKVCVETSAEQLKLVEASRLLEIRYEDLVSEPTTQFAAIAKHLKIEAVSFGLDKLNDKNIGKHKTAFNKEQLDSVLAIIGPTLSKLNYN